MNCEAQQELECKTEENREHGFKKCLLLQLEKYAEYEE